MPDTSRVSARLCECFVKLAGQPVAFLESGLSDAYIGVVIFLPFLPEGNVRTGRFVFKPPGRPLLAGHVIYSFHRCWGGWSLRRSGMLKGGIGV